MIDLRGRRRKNQAFAAWTAVVGIGFLVSQEQDKLAKWLLAELESERQWDEAFAGSSDQLADLADDALEEHRKGRTKPLNPYQVVKSHTTAGFRNSFRKLFQTDPEASP